MNKSIAVLMNCLIINKLITNIIIITLCLYTALKGKSAVMSHLKDERYA